jgi:hypothetical protein
MKAADDFLVYGRLTKLDGDRLRLENDNENDPFREIILDIFSSTLILNAADGTPAGYEALRDGDAVYAYAGSALASGLPPTSAARVILCNIPADFPIPGYFEIQQAEYHLAEGSATLRTNKSMTLHVNSGCRLTPYLAQDPITLSQLAPGTRILAWYPAVMVSMPAQAVPTRIMAFPYSYRGYVEISPAGQIYANGEPLALTADTAPYKNEDGRIMLPLRKLYQALGYTVSWNPQTDNILVSYGGENEFGFLSSHDYAAEFAALGGRVTEAHARIPTLGGVTFVSLEDLAALSKVMFAQK